MDHLIAVIVAWLAHTADLPTVAGPPQVRFAPPQVLSQMRYAGLDAQRRREVVALYADTTWTIHLADDWDSNDPADVSVLVHELVHHLQNVAGLRYACPGEREALAYEAQERWLALFGLTLEDQFGLDPLTLKLSTACFLP